MRTGRAIRPASERDAMPSRPTSPPGLERKLSDDAVENLRKWYEEGFRFVDLCREMIRRNPRLHAKEGGFLGRFLGRW